MQPFASHPVEYAPFENVEARNGIQSRVEIPLLLHLLRPQQGARVLEVGCGRGVALPFFSIGARSKSPGWRRHRRRSRRDRKDPHRHMVGGGDGDRGGCSRSSIRRR